MKIPERKMGYCSAISMVFQMQSHFQILELTAFETPQPHEFIKEQCSLAKRVLD